jgi:hypothetical protein
VNSGQKGWRHGKGAEFQGVIYCMPVHILDIPMFLPLTGALRNLAAVDAGRAELAAEPSTVPMLLRLISGPTGCSSVLGGGATGTGSAFQGWPFTIEGAMLQELQLCKCPVTLCILIFVLCSLSMALCKTWPAWQGHSKRNT